MRKIFFINLLSVLYAIHGFSQVLMWQSCYGSSKDDGINGISKTNNGYIISTSIKGNELQIPGYHASVDGLLIGFDTSGNFLWHRCYGGSSADQFYKLLQNNDNTYYVAGNTMSEDGDLNTPIHGFGDAWLVKLDSNFNIIWQRTFGSEWTEEFRDMCLTSEGGIIILSRIQLGGYNVSQYYGAMDLWVVKFSPEGVLEWEITLGNWGNDNALSMRRTLRQDLETYYIIGSSDQLGGMVECRKSGGYDQDVIIYEIDRVGNLVGQYCYGGSQDDLGYDILPLKDGFIFAASTTSSDMDVSGNHGEHDIWVVRCDSAGAIRWQRCFGGSKDDWPVYIDTARNGRFVIVGTTDSPDGDVVGYHRNRDVWVLSIDSLGHLLTSRCFGSYGDEYSEDHGTVRSGSYSYTLALGARQNSGDITCLPYPGNNNDDIWIFNIKFCEDIYGLMPGRPEGPGMVCSGISPQCTYRVEPVSFAESYAWSLYPAEAGTLAGSDTSVVVSWTPDYEGTATLVVRGKNECGYSVYSPPLPIEVQTCAGLSEAVQSGIRVWPNPAVGQFHVLLPGEMSLPAWLELYRSTGEKVREEVLGEASTSIEIRQLASGLYFWSISYRGGTARGKIMIQQATPVR